MAKSKTSIIPVVIAASITTGCLRTYYPAIYEAGAAPMFFEANNTDTLSSKYYGGELHISSGEYEGESLYLCKGNYAIVNTSDYINTNFKIFVYTCVYNVAWIVFSKYCT